MRTYEDFRQERCRKWLVYLVKLKAHHQKKADWWKDQVRHAEWNLEKSGQEQKEIDYYRLIAEEVGPAMVKLHEGFITDEFKLYSEHKAGRI